MEDNTFDSQALPKNLVIRCDASSAIGNGHVMRCLALAQAWRPHGPTTFVCNQLSAEVALRLQAEGFNHLPLSGQPGTVEDAQQTILSARNEGAKVVCLDGYHFDAGYQSTIRNAGLKLLLLDDVGAACRFSADWILNQNLHAPPASYIGKTADAQLLLGTRFAMLRSEFIAARPSPRDRATALRLLITLGGTDPKNVTTDVLHAIAGLTVPDLQVRIVVGPGNPFRAQIQQAAQRLQCQQQIEFNVQDMPALLQWTDVAITAGGSTCYELFFMQIPFAVIETASNQSAIVAAIAREKAGLVLGTAEQLTPGKIRAALQELLADRALRTRLAEAGGRLVDGQGAARVAEMIAKQKSKLVAAK
jgi:UDP-2,4-diacetamido-2,4,6-trideoxy-beta-L-altropyranose hydrolase